MSVDMMGQTGALRCQKEWLRGMRRRRRMKQFWRRLLAAGRWTTAALGWAALFALLALMWAGVIVLIG